MQKMQPLVIARLQAGHDLSIFKQDYEAALFTTYNEKRNKVFSRNQRIGMLPLFGSMTKYGGLCSYGTQDIIKMMNTLNADPDIDAMVMVTDSPGGSVMGTPEFGEELARSQKPIVSFVDGSMASAAYWAGANTDYIMMNSQEPTAAVGSIGTLYVHVNQSKAIEQNIGEVKIIRAPQSVDKARINSVEPLTEELEAEIVAELKEITDYFINTVSTGRGSSLKVTDAENIFTGKMYKGAEAKKLGMIDSLGSINDAIDRAAMMARSGSYKRKRNSKINSNTQIMSLKDWFGGSSAQEGKATGEETLNVSAAELEQLRTDMQEATQQIEQLTAANAELSEANSELTAANEQLSEENAQQEEENAELQARVEELERKPGAAEGKATKAADVSAQEEEPSFAAGSRSWNEKAMKALGL